MRKRARTIAIEARRRKCVVENKIDVGAGKTPEYWWDAQVLRLQFSSYRPAEKIRVRYLTQVSRSA